MKRASHFRLITAALGLFAGCSGQYHVGSDLANAGSPNQGGAAAVLPGVSSGTSGEEAVSRAGGDAVSSGTGGGGILSNSGGKAGFSAASGGAYALAGSGSVASGAGGGQGVAGGGGSGTGGESYCGFQLPVAPGAEFAPPSVVYQRVFRFVFDADRLPTTPLPSETTRAWAGNLAATALASLSVPSAKGMQRFMKNWWTSTPTPELWAEYFSSRRGTLSDLLTTSRLLPNGAGLLTDPAVLGNEQISARGLFVFQHVACGAIPERPADHALPLPPLVPGQTRRSQLEAAVTPVSCRGCHELIDSFGYPLGKFATDGSFRTVENDLPIDTTAEPPLQSSTLPVIDAQSFGRALANSCEAALCLTREMLRDAILSSNRSKTASNQEVAQVAAQFAAGGLDLSELVRLIAESDAFLSAD